MADGPADVVLIDAFENTVKFGNALFRLGDFTLALLGLFLRFLEPLLFRGFLNLINTVGLCAIACFLPLLFGEFQGLNMFPIGLAILCLNTPICTLLSCDPDMEQAIRVLPGQAGRFCRRYCLFIFIVNGIVASIYLSSWQIIHGGIGLPHVGTVLLFAIQSAILSVILEWKHPIRGWKTESDLWHHPRKYLVPLAMLLMAAFVGTYPPVLGIWSAVLLMECGILLYWARRE